MYAQAAIKPNTLLRNGAYGIVMRGVQKCTCAGASLRGRNSTPLCCIKLDTATDIACGTGVMIDYYIERNVSKVTGVDISSKMIEIARNKFKKYDFIDFLCEDAEEFNFKNQYDRVMVFNAFPHFPNPKALIKNLAKAVKSGGTVTVAHDRGRKDLDNHHKSIQASKISNGLISENALEEIFKSAGLVDIYKKATENIYIVSGVKA